MNCPFLLKIRVINRLLEIFSFADHAEHSAFNFKTPPINKASEETIEIGLQMKAKANYIAKVVNLNNPEENPITTKKVLNFKRNTPLALTKKITLLQLMRIFL